MVGNANPVHSPVKVIGLWARCLLDSKPESANKIVCSIIIGLEASVVVCFAFVAQELNVARTHHLSPVVRDWSL
jgi:hypothetical protein